MSRFIGNVLNVARQIKQAASNTVQAAGSMIGPKTDSTTPRPTNTDSYADRQRRIQRELAMRQNSIVTHAFMEPSPFEAPSAPANPTPTNPTPIMVVPQTTVTLSQQSPTA